MKKQVFSQKLARRTQLPAADAADALDTIVHDLLCRLRQGDAVTWPGLGTFLPEGQGIAFVAEAAPEKAAVKAARRKKA